MDTTATANKLRIGHPAIEGILDSKIRQAKSQHPLSHLTPSGILKSVTWVTSAFWFQSEVRARARV